MKKRKSLKINALLSAIKQCCAILFPLITFPYISRILGNEGFGKYSFAYSVTNYFLLIGAFGVNSYAIREGAKIRDDKEKLTSLASQIYSINICSVIISYLLLFITILTNTKIYSYAPYIIVQSTTMLLSALGTDWINSIYEDYYYITVRYIVFHLIALALMLIFVKSPNDIVLYCVISVLAAGGGNLLNIFYTKKYVKAKFTLKMKLKKHFTPMFILFLNSIAITIYVNSDITMLGYCCSDSMVGIYSFTSKIYNILKQMVYAVLVVFVPRVTYMADKNPKQYKKYIYNIFIAISAILIPIMIGTFCMSKTLIMIAGGTEYVYGARTLSILSIALLFAMYSAICTNCVLIANRKEKMCVYATMVSAGLNVLLNIVLLPQMGILGAAVTTVIAEALNCIMQLFFSREYMAIGEMKVHDIIPCCIGGIMIFVICDICNTCFTNDYLRIVVAFVMSCIFYVYVLYKMKHYLILELIQQIKGKGVKK